MKCANSATPAGNPAGAQKPKPKKKTAKPKTEKKPEE